MLLVMMTLMMLPFTNELCKMLLLILTMLLVMMTLLMLPFTNELCKMLLLILTMLLVMMTLMMLPFTNELCKMLLLTLGCFFLVLADALNGDKLVIQNNELHSRCNEESCYKNKNKTNKQNKTKL